MLPPAAANARELAFLPIEAGNYTATLTITDTFQKGTDTPSTIDSSNTAPFAFTIGAAAPISIVTATVGLEGNLLEFSIAGLPELDNAAVRTVQWSVNAVVDGSSTTADFSYLPVNDGSYTITAVVTDTLLATDFVRTTPTSLVTVYNATPTLVVDHLVGSENAEITLEGTYSDLGAADTHTVSIDWGDGKAPSISPASGGTFLAMHTYLQDSLSQPDGVYPALVTIRDDGGVRTQTISVMIANTAPTVDPALTPWRHRRGLRGRIAATELPENDTDVGPMDIKTITAVPRLSLRGAT